MYTNPGFDERKFTFLTHICQRDNAISREEAGFRRNDLLRANRMSRSLQSKNLRILDCLVTLRPSPDIKGGLKCARLSSR